MVVEGIRYSVEKGRGGLKYCGSGRGSVEVGKVLW